MEKSLDTIPISTAQHPNLKDALRFLPSELSGDLSGSLLVCLRHIEANRQAIEAQAREQRVPVDKLVASILANGVMLWQQNRQEQSATSNESWLTEKTRVMAGFRNLEPILLVTAVDPLLGMRVLELAKAQDQSVSDAIAGVLGDCVDAFMPEPCHGTQQLSWRGEPILE